VLVAITGTIGFALADFAGRYMETTAVAAGQPAGSVPAGMTVANNVATAAFPSWQAIATQFGISAVPFIASGFVDEPWSRAALQGMGLGAGAALFGGLFKSLMVSLIGGTALGQQLYLDEYMAQQAVASNGTAATASATSSLSGLPRGVGRRFVPGRGVGASAMQATIMPAATRPNVAPPATIAPYNPMSQASGPGIMAPPGIMTNSGDIIASPPPGTPTPGGAQAGASCAPCTSTAGGIAGTYNTAQQAIRDESCLGKVPGMYATFPDN
jgi:hypothetical protein